MNKSVAYADCSIKDIKGNTIFSINNCNDEKSPTKLIMFLKKLQKGDVSLDPTLKVSYNIKS